MTVEIPWAYVEVAIGLGACIVIGAGFGVVGTLLRMAGERRGN